MKSKSKTTTSRLTTKKKKNLSQMQRILFIIILTVSATTQDLAPWLTEAPTSQSKPLNHPGLKDGVLSCDNLFTDRFRQNSFRPILQKSVNSSDLITVPIRDTTQFKDPKNNLEQACVREFSQHGSCCNPSTLNTFYQTLIQQNQQRIQSFIDKLPLVYDTFIKDGNGEKFRTLVQALKSWVVENQANSKVQSRLQKSKIGNYLPDLYSRMQFFNNKTTFQRLARRYFNDLAQCQSKTFALRQRVRCTACSGRASSAANGLKMKANYRYPFLVVKSCVRTWSFVYQLVQSLKAFVGLAMVKRGVDPELPGSSGAETSSMVNKITETLTKYQDVEYTEFGFTDDVASMLDDLFWFDEHNDDIEGNPEIIDAALTEFGYIQSGENKVDVSGGNPPSGSASSSSASSGSSGSSSTSATTSLSSTLGSPSTRKSDSLKKYRGQSLAFKASNDALALPPPQKSEKKSRGHLGADIGLNPDDFYQKRAQGLELSSLKPPLQQVEGGLGYWMETADGTFQLYYTPNGAGSDQDLQFFGINILLVYNLSLTLDNSMELVLGDSISLWAAFCSIILICTLSFFN